MTALERASEEEFISSWLISRSITLLFFELFMRKLGEEKEKLKRHSRRRERPRANYHTNSEASNYN